MIDNNPLLQVSPSSINPIEEVLSYQFLGQLDLDDLFAPAKVGLHIYNPYHCLTHELLVAYHALSAYDYGTPGTLTENQKLEKRRLALAAMFHDHNHSGGKTSDSANVDRAIKRIESLPGLSEDARLMISIMILKTEFSNGKFPYAPESFPEKCLRDADLCMIYTNEGRKLLMELPREIDGGPSLYRRNKQYIKEWFAKNRAFLESCEMFTEYGQLMKEFHLARACQDFEDLVNYAVSANYIASNSNWISDATKL
jgi:hypothetical protein